VKLDISLDDENTSGAEKTANGLNDAQTNHLLGPASTAADMHHNGEISKEDLGGVVQNTLELA
jgi:hypothetical protein